MSLNTLIVSGFLGNIDMSYLQSGKAMTKGYVKVGMGKDQVGNWKNEILGFVCYGELAEEVAQFDVDKIYKLTGKLNIRTYKDANGDSRKYIDMVVFQAELDVTPNTKAAPTSTFAQKNRPMQARR